MIWNKYKKMIIIQKPKEEDVKNIQQVFYETWMATYPNEEVGITIADIEERFKNRFSEVALQKRLNDIANKSDNQLFLVAKEDDAVIGVCKLVKTEKYNDLMAIYVLPNYQRNGVGLMFWEKAEEYFGSEKDIIVQVATYNSKAINFYQKLGFVDTGKRFTQEVLKMPISGVYIPEMELIIKAKK